MDAIRGRPGRGCEPELARLVNDADRRLRDLAAYWIEEVEHPSEHHREPPLQRAMKGMAAAFTSFQMGYDDALSISQAHGPVWQSHVAYWQTRMEVIANGPNGAYWLEMFIRRVIEEGMPSANWKMPTLSPRQSQGGKHDTGQ